MRRGKFWCLGEIFGVVVETRHGTSLQIKSQSRKNPETANRQTPLLIAACMDCPF
jgi:hypothetical protein